MGKIILPAVMTVGLLSSSVAFAASPANPATANFNVTITIVKECSVTTPATISLGTYGAVSLISSGASGTTTFNVTCSNGAPYTIGFSSSNDATAGSATHQMKGTGTNKAVVQYQLTDATTGAKNTAALSATTSVISDTGTGAAQAKTLNAAVVNYTAPVAPDTYTDTVTLSVSY
jgi:spore coat protein U-like protein